MLCKAQLLLALWHYTEKCTGLRILKLGILFTYLFIYVDFLSTVMIIVVPEIDYHIYVLHMNDDIHYTRTSSKHNKSFRRRYISKIDFQ